jgi:hypothetical protein
MHGTENAMAAITVIVCVTIVAGLLGLAYWQGHRDGREYERLQRGHL